MYVGQVGGGWVGRVAHKEAVQGFEEGQQHKAENEDGYVNQREVPHAAPQGPGTPLLVL